MSPVPRDLSPNVANSNPRPEGSPALVLEAWAQGYMVGSLIIMSFITLANMRRGVILHKLILIELLLGIWQGFWLFPTPPIDTWWLSVAAIPLNISWFLHNVIAWMKIKPFLPRFWKLVFIYTVILSFPYWVVEIYANFAYFHGINDIFKSTRPFELLFRDPWWIVTTVYLFIVIKTQYEMTIKDIVRISPRFGIMLGAMLISIAFIICDVLSVTGALKMPGTTGINPFWKLAFVFKCLTDSVILDDFKMALDRLRAFKISRLGSFSQENSDRRTRNDGNLVEAWEKAEREAHKHKRKPSAQTSPDGDYLHPNFTALQPVHKPREQNDSLVAPDPNAFRSSNLSLDPEDIVPSAIEDPPLRSMEDAHQSARRHPEWPGDLEDLEDVAHLAAESDYAQALREVEGQSPPASPSRSSFARRSHPT